MLVRCMKICRGKVEIWLKSGKNVGPLREDLNAFYCGGRHYEAIKALSSSEDSRGGINITRTRSSVML
jgi:hypothetical protein